MTPEPKPADTTINPHRELDDVLVQACRRAGYPHRDHRLLRHVANAVYLVPHVPVVARVGYGAGVVTRSRRAVQITRWLAHRGFPATAPAALPTGADQPLLVALRGGPAAVTFWHYYPPNDRPLDLVHLAALARRLHAIPDRPQVTLPRFSPLLAVRRAMSDRTCAGALSPPDRIWLRQRIRQVRADYQQLDSKLGVGLLHGDLYLGNILWGTEAPVLGDWDTVCIGPREVDLAPTFSATRFGLVVDDVDRFAEGYGHDLRAWDGYATLRTIRELSTLDTLIRSAPSRPASAAELRHRLGTLRRGDTATLWHPQ
jgi:hypothetical protein